MLEIQVNNDVKLNYLISGLLIFYETILSLSEGNKWQKHYLAGIYGQGGSSTFAVCKYTLIAAPLLFVSIRLLQVVSWTILILVLQW
jgi:hypothetical protein